MLPSTYLSECQPWEQLWAASVDADVGAMRRHIGGRVGAAVGACVGTLVGASMQLQAS